MLLGIVLVIFAFNLAAPISSLSASVARHARHRARRVLLVVTDDDHAHQGDRPGDRLPGDGERACSSPPPRHLGMPMVVELGHRARRADRMVILGVFMSPDPRAVSTASTFRKLERLKEE